MPPGLFGVHFQEPHARVASMLKNLEPIGLVGQPARGGISVIKFVMVDQLQQLRVPLHDALQHATHRRRARAGHDVPPCFTHARAGEERVVVEQGRDVLLQSERQRTQKVGSIPRLAFVVTASRRGIPSLDPRLTPLRAARCARHLRPDAAASAHRGCLPQWAHVESRRMSSRPRRPYFSQKKSRRRRGEGRLSFAPSRETSQLRLLYSQHRATCSRRAEPTLLHNTTACRHKRPFAVSSHE